MPAPAVRSQKGSRASLVRGFLALLTLPLLTSVDLRGADTAPPLAQAELRVRILDAATDQPVPCTVHLTDAAGHVLTDGAAFPGGFRTTGVFTQSVAAGSIRMRVTRGPEYLAAERNVTVPAGGIVALDIPLNRQVDLRQRGWFAQDHHAHMLHGERTLPVTFDQVALAARAEGLQALSLAQAWPIEQPTPERLDAELELRSDPDCQLTWNLEAPKNYFLGDAGRCLGHCWTLGMQGRTPDGDDVIAMLLQASAWDYESEKPSFANFESHALIRSQNGAVFYTHPARWWTGPWGGQGDYPTRAVRRISNMAVELPLDTLAGPTFDGLDVITGVNESAADEKAFQLWSLLLNHGYRVAATASSDACFDRRGGATPGAARLYTFLDEPFSLTAAARAAAKGRTFATTGPLLLASVDGQPPGTSFPADGRPYALRLEAWPSGAATGRLDRVEVYRNGERFRQFSIPSDTGAWSTQLTLSPTQSVWYCARAFTTDAQTQRAVSGAFFFDPTPWSAPAPVPATIHARVVDATTGAPVQASFTEVTYVGTRAIPGRRHRADGGAALLEIPATARLRAEAEGYEPVTLSPFFDHPELLREITTLEVAGLLDWRTFERIRSLLGRVPLTFQLSPAAKR